MKICHCLVLIGLLSILSSCSKEPVQSEITHSELIGHWNISVPSGLQFVEFVSDNRILIGDRGALGPKDISHHYYLPYSYSDNTALLDHPSESSIENIIIQGDRMTFDFVNQVTGINYNFVAQREGRKNLSETNTRHINQTWITIEENGNLIPLEDRKIAYFSPAGIYGIKNIKEDLMQMFSWEWSSQDPFSLCYSEYQRPTLIPRQSCMNFIELTESYSIFEINGKVVKLEPTALY